MTSKSPKTLRLILGDQLNYRHSWFRKPDSSVLYVLLEMRQETDYVRHHIQKVCAFFLAMRRFAEWLQSKGHAVQYRKLDDPENRQSLADNITALVDAHDITKFEYQLPDEYRLDRQLRELADGLPCDTSFVDSEHFFTSREDVAALFEEKKQWRMETFYRHMRRQQNILLDDNYRPAGGKWNYDIENRRKYDSQVPLPEPKLFRNDASEVVRLIGACGIQTIGKIQEDSLIWPVTRQQSLLLLRYFVDHLLEHFGTYQDAMTTKSWSLFHARLSFSLNSKQLHPREVIEQATAAWRDRPAAIGLAQVEGFIRQILGWREYMRGVYWAHMPDFAAMNYFNHRAKLPGYYWNGQTLMRCMASSIGQSLEHAYAHHIQRLMVTGNFALLAGIDPSELDGWYLGIYIDAVEWVELPNTRGMSQYADGGITASKPYVSTANYIHGQSDYCQSCYYDRKKKHGDRACPFNSLHWDFYHRHRKLLEGNHRIGPMYRVWDRMADDERRKILDQAKTYCRNIEKL